MPALAAPQRSLSLLLVDDDPLILKSLQDCLEADGHLITIADGGQAGVDAFNAALQRGACFDAVITDLGMPHFDGRRVAAAVEAVSPDTPVILLTGWGRRLLGDGEIPQHVDQVLSKPPKVVEIRHALAMLVVDPPPQEEDERSSDHGETRVSRISARL
jgi:CheY-like chemotaxis protein